MSVDSISQNIDKTTKPASESREKVNVDEAIAESGVTNGGYDANTYCKDTECHERPSKTTLQHPLLVKAVSSTIKLSAEEVQSIEVEEFQLGFVFTSGTQVGIKLKGNGFSINVFMKKGPTYSKLSEIKVVKKGKSVKLDEDTIKEVANKMKELSKSDKSLDKIEQDWLYTAGELLDPSEPNKMINGILLKY